MQKNAPPPRVIICGFVYHPQRKKQMTGIIRAIHIARERRGAMEEMSEVELVADCGVSGDAHFAIDTPHESQLTLIAEEEIARARAAGINITASASRRNLATGGIDLNALVGRRFRVGDAVAEGMELCEPCAYLGGQLADEKNKPAAVVAALTHRAGLRARIVEGGIARVGDTVEEIKK
jgi:MOSC domain-containing protein YiiM